MRFAAYTRAIFVVAFVAAITSAFADSKQSKQDCAVPPGPKGTIQCESDQVAICDARKDRVEGQCLDKGGRTGKALQAYLLSRILGQEVKPEDLRREEYQEILREGKVVYERGPGGPISGVVIRVISFSYEDK